MNRVVRSVVAAAAGFAVAGLAVAGAEAPAGAAPATAPADQHLPTAEQVTAILSDLADPDIPDRMKKHLVQGGVNDGEREAFRHDRLAKAVSHGQLPLSFTTGNVWWVGPNTAAAQVTVSGAKLPPVTKVVTLVDQDGWMLSSDSAATLIQTVAKS